MLAAALTLAILGFAALVVALYLGSTTWAWICVVIGALGIILSLYEWIKYGRHHHRNKRR